MWGSIVFFILMWSFLGSGAVCAEQPSAGLPQFEQAPPAEGAAGQALPAERKKPTYTYMKAEEFESYQGEADEARLIEGIDYSNLSLSQALDRFVKVNPDLNIARLQAEQSDLRISQEKADTWLPKASLTLKSFAPVGLISDKNEAKGIFAGEEFKVIFRLNSDSFDSINKHKATYQASLLEVKETLTKQARNLISTYLELALAQRSLEIAHQNLQESKVLLEDIKTQNKYSGIEVAQAEHFVARIFEKKLTAYQRLKTAQRNLKFMLGLEDEAGIGIRVKDSFLSMDYAEDFIAAEDINYQENSLLVLQEKIKEAAWQEKIAYEPLFEVAASVTANASQGTEDTAATTSAISTLQLNFFITDFGYSKNYNLASRNLRELAELELKQRRLKLQQKHTNLNIQISNIKKRIKKLEAFIEEAESAISLFKTQLKMPVNVLYKRNDQLVEAEYLLKELIRDYIYYVSVLEEEYASDYKVSPEYQDLDFADIIEIASSNQTIEEKIVAKKIELETHGLNMAELAGRPKLRAGLSIGNETYTEGESENTTIAYTSLNGKIFSIKNHYAVKKARARLNNAQAQKNLVYNEKYTQIIKSYIKATQIKRRIELINRIVTLKDKIIKEYEEGFETGLPKYEEVDLKPLLMEQIESRLALAKWELELNAEKNNLKYYCGIPLTEYISLRDEGILDWRNDAAREQMIEIIKNSIEPEYDARASIKSAALRVDEFAARIHEAEAFEGISWRLLAQGRGDELKGWEDPNKQIGISFSIPFGGSDKKQIQKSIERNDLLRSQLEVIESQKDLEKLINQTKSRYDAARAMAANLSRELDNLSRQLEIITQYHNMGIKARRDLIDAKMRFLAMQLDYEDKMQSFLDAESQLLLVLGELEESAAHKKTAKIKNLKDAIQTAIKNSPELAVYREICLSEKDSIKFYKPLYADGTISSDYIYEDNKESGRERNVDSFIALAGLDIDLVNKYLRNQQELKYEISKIDLKKKRFEISTDVAEAYSNYAESLATLEAVRIQLEAEGEKLEALEPGSEAKTSTEMDYLRQMQVFSMVEQKYAAITEDCDNYKKRLLLLLFGPENNYADIEITELDSLWGGRPLPADIKKRLAAELRSAYPDIIKPLGRDNLTYGMLQIAEAENSKQAISKQIKSILLDVGYAYLSDELSELALLEEERLSLPLLRDDDLESLQEFVTLNISAKIYDPTTRYNSKIKSIDKAISQHTAEKNLRTSLEEAQRIFDEYEIALINYEYASDKVYKIEEKMQQSMEEIKKMGKLSVIEEMEIIDMLIKNRTDREIALHTIIALRRQLNEYLKEYTGFGLRELAEFSSLKTRSN